MSRASRARNRARIAATRNPQAASFSELAGISRAGGQRQLSTTGQFIAPPFPAHWISSEEGIAVNITQQYLDFAKQCVKATPQVIGNAAFNHLYGPLLVQAGYADGKIPPQPQQGFGWDQWIAAWWRMVEHVIDYIGQLDAQGWSMCSPAAAGVGGLQPNPVPTAISGGGGLTQADIAYLMDRAIRFAQTLSEYAGVPSMTAINTQPGRDAVAGFAAVALVGDDTNYVTDQPSVGFDGDKQFAAYHLVRDNIKAWVDAYVPQAHLPSGWTAIALARSGGLP